MSKSTITNVYRSLIGVCVWNEVGTRLQNLMEFSFWITFQLDQFAHLTHLVTKVLCKGIVGTRTSLRVVLLKN